MKRFFFFLFLFLTTFSYGYAADGKQICLRFQKLAEANDKNAPEAEKQLIDFIQSLKKNEFLELIRELGKDSAWGKSPDASEGMAFLGGFYYGDGGPGEKELPLETLEQLKDPTLPDSWKCTVPGALQRYEEKEPSESELTTAVKLLCEIGLNEKNSILVRSACFQELSWMLRSRLYSIMETESTVEDILMRQDIETLAKIIQTNPRHKTARKALVLLGLIQECQIALRKAADETKDKEFRGKIQIMSERLKLAISSKTKSKIGS